MLYAIGIPVVCLLVVATLGDIRRRSQKEKLTSAKEFGEVQFYKDINNNRNT
jgi:hypothetical protein